MNQTESFPAEDPEVEVLLSRAQEGDQQAWDDLFRLYREQIRRFIGLRMDGRLRQRLDVSDVLQETEIQVFRRMADFLKRRPMAYRLWLQKTAYERLLLLRRQHVEIGKRAATRDYPLPERSSLMLAKKLLASGITPSENIGRQELVRRVHVALAELDEADREIVLMRYVEGLSYNEVACILDIEAAAARKRHGRALVRLHRALSDGGLTESQL